VDIVPLDPLLFANIHERLNGSKDRFEMPVPVYEEQKAVAERTFSALAKLYRENEGRIKKLPFPCIYSEDDLRVIRDAFHRMRVFLLHVDGVDIASAGALVDYLGRKHPGCRPFLRDLLAYYRRLTGASGKTAFGNNLYRCLLQFMAQLLSGSSEISLDRHDKRLGITVGIITRNRAADLRDALRSLTRQARPADEVLIVDNGSTDETSSVVESFRERLPLSYHFLEEASIPMARNLVIDRAGHDIVAFTDDDCVPEPRWLEVVERGFLRAENVGIVGGWVRHEPAPEPSMIDTYYSIFHHNKS
jgi:cellulose synthase/poly-beta-1,6-N-acetylglucosamine synthase-like glycosyltransferase